MRQRAIAEQLRVNISKLRGVGREFGLDDLQINKLLDLLATPAFQDDTERGQRGRLEALADFELDIRDDRGQREFSDHVLSVLKPSLALPF